MTSDRQTPGLRPFYKYMSPATACIVAFGQRQRQGRREDRRRRRYGRLDRAGKRLHGRQYLSQIIDLQGATEAPFRGAPLGSLACLGYPVTTYAAGAVRVGAPADAAPASRGPGPGHSRRCYMPARREKKMSVTCANVASPRTPAIP
jgi:hypothetical protein